ncbi:hypothetical protein BOX15_Mlig005015g3, partial [Macrostomum lignano]
SQTLVAMETILELQRRLHEERERLLNEICREKKFQPRTHRERVNSDHRLKAMLDRHKEASRQLKELYEDKDGLRKADIQALSGPNEFAELNERLQTIREHHRRRPDEIAAPLSAEFDRFVSIRDNPDEAGAQTVEFSDEEGYGRYLDLHLCHDRYLNLKGVDCIDYATYLSIFDRLFDVPRERKATAAYRQYAQQLLAYLSDFCGRSRPLIDLDAEFSSAEAALERQWPTGEFPGWPKEAASAMAHSGAHLDLAAFSRWEELASLGLDRLKSALTALGLKCGGTLEERARRLWSTKGRRLADLEPGLFAKRPTGAPAAAPGHQQQRTEAQREVAAIEARIYRLCELLSEERAASREKAVRKQAQADYKAEDSDEEDIEMMTPGGRGADMRDDDDDDQDEDDVPYNPKNLPLGWDGKPIPYWLYKLHGLNLYYTCEICGNHTYRGPKAFQRHFAEWRHAHGMRCLGIPNTAHFANVTSIEDAIALWQRLRTQKEQERWRPDAEEEFEDSMGNVVTKKVYEDLKRQGLL